MVFQDNLTDGDGLGISARSLSPQFAGGLGQFRVNQAGAGDQENAKVAILNDGGAVFVWQGGSGGNTDIFARFMKPDGTFLGGDLPVNTYNRDAQIDPSVAVLTDGSVVVAWTSYGQDGDKYGVYAQRFSPSGQKVGAEFPVNRVIVHNQRSPGVVKLGGGGFAIAWVTERVSGIAFASGPTGSSGESSAGALTHRISILANTYDSQGNLVKSDLQLDGGTANVSGPSLAPAGDGGFVAAWSAWTEAPRVLGPGQNIERGWDTFIRAFGSDGTALGQESLVNTHTFGDQFGVQVSSSQDTILAVWSSLGQEGFAQGVYARSFDSRGAHPGDVFRVNSTTDSPQLYPAVASDSRNRFLVAWSTHQSGVTSYELVAQRYSVNEILLPPAPPFVFAGGQTRLTLTWPEISGLDVSTYELFIDDASAAISITGQRYELRGLEPGSTHQVRLAYRLANGKVSPTSAPAVGATWGEDENLDGLPDDWQRSHWGSSSKAWPGAGVDSDSDGLTNAQELLAGTSPVDASSALKISIVAGSVGKRLEWNVTPGLLYQVQSSPDLTNWSDFGPARLAVQSSDSVSIEDAQSGFYFRVVRVK